MTISQTAKEMKKQAPILAATSGEARNAALAAIRDALRKSAKDIFEANAIDMAKAKENGVSEAVKKRLKFDENKLRDVCDGIDSLIGLEDPVGVVMQKRQLDEGLILKQVSVPIGVLGVIFEARPDALVQIASLCIKSANACILKGGSETKVTNATLFRIIHNAVIESDLPAATLAQADSHSEIDELLKCEEYVDLIIPRGSNAFVKYIMDNTSIPVMGHADGICHTYLDGAADINKALPIVADAKLQYSAACNATETLLIDRSCDRTEVAQLLRGLSEKGVILHGSEEVKALAPEVDIADLPEDGYHHEYLDSNMSVAMVSGVEEAVLFINSHGSHHTDAILTEDNAAKDYFMSRVDSAGVYHNISTRFADGFRYGFGAEVGISTGKIHARGPVGLPGLTTYKYLIEGDGHIVGDYAEGRKSFHFCNL